MKRTRLMAVGHLCLDITPLLSGDECTRVEDYLQPGKLIEAGPAVTAPGGVVHNTGLAMKLFGADVAAVGKIGDDPFGRIVYDYFEKRGAADRLIMDPSVSTSYTSVIAIPGIDRIFLHNPGANNDFGADDIDYDLCDEALVFHFGYPPLMRRFFLNDGEELVRMYKNVRERGCITSLDLAAVDPRSEAGTADWKKILESVLPYVDFFVPSIEEALFMTDRDHYEELQKRAAGDDITRVLDIEKDVAPLAKELLGMGCSFVMLKCGAAGFYYRSSGNEGFDGILSRSGADLHDFAGREGFEKSFVPERVVSGTGAGDTTIAAFLTAMSRGYSFEECISLASAAGASCVEAADALSGLAPLDELMKRIKGGWAKS